MVTLMLFAVLALDASPSFTKPVKADAPIKATAQAEPVLNSVAVTLECTARRSGQVDDCHVLAETHPGRGFGEAAVALMRDARVAPGPTDIQFARTIQFTP
jgi:TonB family protein